MIFRPVTPESPIGPPMTKRPVGLMKNLVFLSSSFLGSALRDDLLAHRLVDLLVGRPSSACCVDTTTVSMRTGLAVLVLHRHLALAVRAEPVERLAPHVREPPGERVRVVRWAPASARASRRTRSRTSFPGRRRPAPSCCPRRGRCPGSGPRWPPSRRRCCRRSPCRCRCSRCGRWCCGRCSGCRRSSWSSPRRRRWRGRSSPASPPPRGLRGPCARIASSTPSLIWSAILSGWPSVTDSEVKRKSLGMAGSSVVLRKGAGHYRSAASQVKPIRGEKGSPGPPESLARTVRSCPPGARRSPPPGPGAALGDAARWPVAGGAR